LVVKVQSFSPHDTVPELLAAQAAALGEREALAFEGTPCSYAQLEERVARAQRWLGTAGVKPGDRVALLMRNSLEFVYAWLGIARAGAIAVPVNPELVGDALAYMVGHSGAVGVIADDDLLSVLDRSGTFPELRWRVAAQGGAGGEPFAALLDAEPAPAPARGLEAGTPMTIVYTSGTTGLPKGVVLPHGSYTNTGAYFARHLGLTSDDRLHTCLPLFHCNAQQCSVMPGLHLGTTVSLNARFSVSRFWSWIEESRATITNLLGTMLTLLAKAPPGPQDEGNTLRFVVGAPIPEPLQRPFEERFGVRLVEGYGLSETGTMAAMNPVADTRVGTFGLPLEYTELRVVDERDQDVPDGTPGELLVRTHVPHSFMLGYFKEPEKTAEAMRGGWFHTGDSGLRRDDGYFVFLDRLKDSIRRRGENISSFQVEKTILDHPDVSQCAVFAVPSELAEDDVKVVAVLRDGASLAPEELVAFCEQRMAGFMVPRYVELRTTLPLTETGRVHKFKLREEGIGSAWDRERAGAAQ
jgi:carnitine-CoA ligase